MLTDQPEIICVLVQFQDGEEVWVSLSDYQQNPTPGSFIVRERRRRLSYP